MKIIAVILSVFCAWSVAQAFVSATPGEYDSLRVGALVISPQGAWNVLLRDYIEKLVQCESAGHTTALNEFDGNGWHSRGPLQFQYPTFTEQLERFGMMQPHWEKEDIINLMHTAELPRELAFRMLSEDGAWWHWKICGKRVGLDVFINLYKENSRYYE